MKKINIIVTTISIAMSMSALRAQNVGIGTAKPLEKLHVAGNIKTDTLKSNELNIARNAGAGKVLTSDESGNASWKENPAAMSSQRTAEASGTGFGTWGDCSMSNISQYQPIADTLPMADACFGGAVAISGEHAVIGTPLGSTIATSMYRHDGDSWVLIKRLAGIQGYSLSISGNYVIVGSPDMTINGISKQGRASIYQYDGSNWVLMQHITDNTGSFEDRFGYNVSISGNYAIVGAPYDDVGSNTDQGSVSIFQYNGTSWVLMQKLTESTGAADDSFGRCVAISGNYAIVGIPYDDIANLGGTSVDRGSIRIYQYSGTSWGSGVKMSDPNGLAEDRFGFSVAISNKYAAIGSLYDETGSKTGSVFIYQRTGSSWSLMEKMTDTENGTYFGIYVSLSADYLLVGATEDRAAGLYYRLGNGWRRIQRITDPQGTSGDYFGGGVAIDASTKRFVIGSFGYRTNSGCATFGKIE